MINNLYRGLLPVLCGIFMSSFFISNIACAESQCPKGYLVPTPSSIPGGLSQIEHPFPSCSKESYVFDYTSNDHISRLTISEYPENPYENYTKAIDSYELLIQHSKKWHSYVKIGEVSHMGASGVIFHTVTYSTGGYDLVLDDNKRMLRINAQDGPNFHFTIDMVMSIVGGLVRQN